MSFKGIRVYDTVFYKIFGYIKYNIPSMTIEIIITK